nr:MAG TPA: hypothetical protein [Bacteriophage sp.]
MISFNSSFILRNSCVHSSFPFHSLCSSGGACYDHSKRIINIRPILSIQFTRTVYHFIP